MHPVPRWYTSTRHPLCAIDIYRAIYILPNILSLGKWPRARAKLLNIQAGNEAKFVCVSACSRHRYTSGSSSSALLPDCILSRDGIILQCTVLRACSHARTDLRSRDDASEENLTLSYPYTLEEISCKLYAIVRSNVSNVNLLSINYFHKYFLQIRVSKACFTPRQMCVIFEETTLLSFKRFISRQSKFKRIRK